MRTIPILLSTVSVMFLAATASAGPVLLADSGGYTAGTDESQVLVELVPDNPGPYTGGEHLTVDVWLHSLATVDVWPKRFRFDFSDTDPAITLDPTFVFDFSTADPPNWYQIHPDLPTPWAWNDFLAEWPFGIVPFPAGGSVHIGSIGASLPADPGLYRMDLLNADEPDPTLGAMIQTKWWIESPEVTWRAYDNEIIEGTHDFAIIPEPTMLTLCLMAALGLALRQCPRVCRESVSGPVGSS